MTQAVAGGWSRWIAGMAMGAALGFFAVMAFGQDSALVAQGKQIFNDQGCYGCHTMGQSGTPIAPDLSKIARDKRGDVWSRCSPSSCWAFLRGMRHATDPDSVWEDRQQERPPAAVTPPLGSYPLT
jgi:cytochrome c2